MNIRATYAFSALLLTAAAGLSACTNSMKMQMPTGYVYHDQIYKSPPGPESTIKEAKIVHVDTSGMNRMGSETVTMNAPLPPGFDPDNPAIREQLRLTADELIARLLRNLGRPMEPTFVIDSSPLTAALKDSMARNQLPVAVNLGDGPFVIEHVINGADATMTFYSNHDPVRSDMAPVLENSAVAPMTDLPPDMSGPADAIPEPIQYEPVSLQ